MSINVTGRQPKGSQDSRENKKFHTRIMTKTLTRTFTCGKKKEKKTRSTLGTIPLANELCKNAFRSTTHSKGDYTGAKQCLHKEIAGNVLSLKTTTRTQ